jgi:hypothetical protein
MPRSYASAVPRSTPSTQAGCRYGNWSAFPERLPGRTIEPEERMRRIRKTVKVDFREFHRLLSQNPALSADDKAFGAKFLEDIAGQDAVGVIIRAHLYVESTLNQLIKECLFRPKAMNGVELSFRFKVPLAAALGIIPDDFQPPLEQLNALRNKLAHRLDAEISDSDLDRLFHSFAKDDRQAMTGDKQLQNILAYMHGCLHGQLNRVRQAKAEQGKSTGEK